MATRRTIRHAEVGNIALNGGYTDLPEQPERARLMEGIHFLLRYADPAMRNFEGPLNQRPSTRLPWRSCLRGHPRNAFLLMVSRSHAPGENAPGRQYLQGAESPHAR